MNQSLWTTFKSWKPPYVGKLLNTSVTLKLNAQTHVHVLGYFEMKNRIWNMYKFNLVINLLVRKRDIGKQCRPRDLDQMLQNMVSDQDLHCLHTGIFIKNKMIESEKVHQTPLISEMDLSSWKIPPVKYMLCANLFQQFRHLKSLCLLTFFSPYFRRLC